MLILKNKNQTSSYILFFSSNDSIEIEWVNFSERKIEIDNEKSANFRSWKKKKRENFKVRWEEKKRNLGFLTVFVVFVYFLKH